MLTAIVGESRKRLPPALQESSLRAFGRDVERIRRMLEANLVEEDVMGPALDPGGDGPLGEVWPWELSGFTSAEALIESLMDEEQRSVLGRILSADGLDVTSGLTEHDVVAWWAAGMLSAAEARRAGRLSKQLPAGCELIVYADEFEPAGDEALYELGISILSRETFPDGPPSSLEEFLLRIGQHEAHARLGIGSNHSPLTEPALAEAAALRARGLEMPNFDDSRPASVRPGRERDDIAMMAWISAGLQERPSPNGPSPQAIPIRRNPSSIVSPEARPPCYASGERSVSRCSRDVATRVRAD